MANTGIKNTQEPNKETTPSGATTPRPQSPEGGQMSSTPRQSHEQKLDKDKEAGINYVKERGSEMVDQARETFTDVYERASRNVNSTLDHAVDYSRENPGKTTLIAFGAGIGIGLLLAGSFTPRSRTRRLVPPVMNALSDIANEFLR